MERLGANDEERGRNAEALLRAAENEGIRESPEAQADWNQVLLENYLLKKLQEAKVPREMAEPDVKRLYEEQPLIRIRSLVILASSPAEKEQAIKKVEKIRREFESGTAFPKLVLKYSDDASSRARGGDLDFRGVHNLPSAIYEAAKRQKPNEISEPIDLGESIHLIQVVGIRTWEQAGAPYLELLRARNREKEIQSFTSKLIAEATAPAPASAKPQERRPYRGNPRVEKAPSDWVAEGQP